MMALFYLLCFLPGCCWLYLADFFCLCLCFHLLRFELLSLQFCNWVENLSIPVQLGWPRHNTTTYISGLCVSTVMLRTGGQELEPTKGNIVSQHFDLNQEWRVSLQVENLKRADCHTSFYFSSNLPATQQEPLIFFILLVVGMVTSTETGPLLFSSIIHKVYSLFLQWAGTKITNRDQRKVNRQRSFLICQILGSGRLWKLGRGTKKILVHSPSMSR